MKNTMMTITPLILERYLCGEVTGLEKAYIDSVRKTDPEIQRTIDALHASSEKILTEYPPEEIVREIERKAHIQETRETVRSDVRRMSAGVFPRFRLAGMVVALIVILPFSLYYYTVKKPAGETIRSKGLQPTISIYRKSSDGYEKLEHMSIVHSGQLIQIGYVSAGKKYGCIVSVDGNGTVTVHYPEDTSPEARLGLLKEDGEHLLAESFELDDAPEFERFFYITSNRPIVSEKVVEQCLRQFDPVRFGKEKTPVLQLPKTYQQQSILLTKDTTR
ncbi:MAG: hypothetical protein JW863_08865 [Chitinispirillaceae bacterium]|nr:hypothetical protein [Chitinispirillaceae bacterium]